MNAVIENYMQVIKNATNFSDRAGRSEYWMFFLANFAIGIMLTVVDVVTGIPVLGLLFMLAMIVPGIAVTVRRLHDGDRSAWWLLAAFVPILGPIALLVLMAMPGTPTSNQFGPPAPGNATSELASA